MTELQYIERVVNEHDIKLSDLETRLAEMRGDVKEAILLVNTYAERSSTLVNKIDHLTEMVKKIEMPSREDWEKEIIFNKALIDIQELQKFKEQVMPTLSTLKFAKRYKRGLLIVAVLLLLPVIDLFLPYDLTGWAAKKVSVPQVGLEK
jgi:hypothetical protein